MRFLHTGDIHLGRTIRGQSRQPEFERVLPEVADIARRERIDCVIIAGDVFDTFAPPPEAEKLLYETLGEILRDGARVVMIAGNHDSALRMDALAGILRIAGIDCIGSVPHEAAQSVIRIASRDGAEQATVAALPWVPERYAVEYETLFQPPENALQQYSARLEAAVARCCEAFTPATVNVFVGHMLLSGAAIQQGGGERKLHIGDNFAVQAACFPGSAQYVALGHVHKMQQLAAAAPVYYAGSLLQLDFGEAGQEKYVNVVDIKPRTPAEIHPIAITGGRGLRTVRLRLDELPQHVGRYGDDFLRVVVELDGPAAAVYERVREFLPNALDVTAERTNEPTPRSAERRSGLAPHELLARYYAEKVGGEIPAQLIATFNELYEAETGRAPA